ncbi:MAG TPA: TRAP transporter substrate-binding protein [Alphaproteobacteria bacterium]
MLKFAATAAGIVCALTFAGEAAAQQIVAKYSTPTINDVVHDGMKLLQQRVHARVDTGKFRIDIFPAGQLGAIPRVIEGVQLGTIEMATVPPEFIVGLDTRFGIVSAPGIFDSKMHGFHTLYDPEFKKEYWELGKNKGIVLIGAQCNAEVVYVSRRQVTKLADLRGMKIRSYPSAIEREAFKRLGATVAPMPLDEVLPGLQQGVIDATKGGASVFVAFKTYTIAKYITRTKDTLVCPIHFANKGWWDKLPADVRTALEQEYPKADLDNMKHSNEGEIEAFEAWKKNGGEINELPPAEAAELKKLMSTVGETALENDPPAKAMYDLMVKAAQRTRAKL